MPEDDDDATEALWMAVKALAAALAASSPDRAAAVAAVRAVFAEEDEILVASLDGKPPTMRASLCRRLRKTGEIRDMVLQAMGEPLG